MKTSLISLPVVLLLSLATACSSVPTKDIQIQTEAAPTARFSGYTTYTWLGHAAILADSADRWTAPDFDVDAEIKHLIDRELRARGMSESSAKPGLLVAFAIGVDMDSLQLKVDPSVDMKVLTNVPEAGLLVVFVDATTGLVVWAGVASAEVQEGQDSATAKARMDYAVREMLRRLPR